LKRPLSASDLEQLEQERVDADDAYNRALTALDRAVPAPPAIPGLPRPDDHLIPRLNEIWKIVPEHPVPPARGVRTRLAAFVWRLVGPHFERQQAFNAALVDHVNRTMTVARDSAATMASLSDSLRDYLGAVNLFHSHLIVYLQQLTLYVDTKDRRATGGLMSVYDPAIAAVSDELLMRWESMVAREQRFAARVEAVNAGNDDVRGTLAVVQQSTLTLKRELERLLAAAPSAPATRADSAAPRTAEPAIDSYKYVGFEDRFRGSQDDIRQRLTDYIPDFAGGTDVLDVGCGRGEFLDLLRGAGIGARGLDVNHEMVEVCRARGLDANEGDALGYLQSLADASLGGLFAAQVVEHLEPTYLMRTLDAAYHKLRPGSRIVLETINPACWYAFFASYIRDLTHVRPIHPETLQYLLTASGFQRVEIRYRAPYPEHEKLQLIPADPAAPEAVRAAIDTLNGNASRLNALLFTFLDYAAVATRL
jgi:O-antigen chain-terminating methyltransferase